MSNEISTYGDSTSDADIEPSKYFYEQGYEYGWKVPGYLPEYELGKYVPSYTPKEFKYHDSHATVTTQLCDLIEYGYVNWYTTTYEGVIVPDSEWVWDYYDLDQYRRVCDKFNERFYWDEISIIPPMKWKQQLLRKINEIMPKYKIIYKAIDSGIDPLATSSNYGKSRNIYSEFPETLLNGNSDYVSNGNDNEFENVTVGDTLSKYKEIASKFDDVDVMILKELEVLFSSLYTVSVNGL